MKESKGYALTSFGDYAEGLGTLRASGGDIGGGQRGIDFMWKGINGDIAGTLDSNYFKGCGEREGLEREIVYWVNDELSGSDRLSEPRGASGKLQRTGCVQRYVGDR